MRRRTTYLATVMFAAALLGWLTASGCIGKGSTITMTANGKTIAEGRMEKTIPVQFSLGEGLDIGMDIGSPVDFTYKLSFAFTGKIEKVTVELK